MNNLVQQKIKMWEDKLQELETRYQLVVQKRGEAAQMGDLRENAAFLDADEETAVLRKRVDDVKKILEELKGGTTKPAKNSQS